MEAFQKAPPDIDLVITDYTMPEMGGLALAEEICRIKPGQPVLICTGLGNHMEVIGENRHFVAGFLGKPVEIPLMAATIRQALDRASKGGTRS